MKVLSLVKVLIGILPIVFPAYSMQYTFSGDSLLFKDIKIKQKARLHVAWHDDQYNLLLPEKNLNLKPLTTSQRIVATLSPLHCIYEKNVPLERKICTLIDGEPEFKKFDFDNITQIDKTVSDVSYQETFLESSNHQPCSLYNICSSKNHTHNDNEWNRAFVVRNEQNDQSLPFEQNSDYITAHHKNGTLKIVSLLRKPVYTTEVFSFLWNFTSNQIYDFNQYTLPRSFTSIKHIIGDFYCFMESTGNLWFDTRDVIKQNFHDRFVDFVAGPAGQFIALTKNHKLIYATLGKTEVQDEQRSACFKPHRRFKELLTLPCHKEHEIIQLWFTENNIGIYQGPEDYTDGILTIYELTPEIYELKISDVKAQEDPEHCIQKALTRWKK